MQKYDFLSNYMQQLFVKMPAPDLLKDKAHVITYEKRVTPDII